MTSSEEQERPARNGLARLQCGMLQLAFCAVAFFAFLLAVVNSCSGVAG